MINEKNKDTSPEATIQNIIDILMHKLSIEIQQGKLLTLKNNINEVISASTRVFWDIPVCGTNGKGTNSKYALASAYSEFMERLQNRLILSDEYIVPDLKFIKQDYFLKSELNDFYQRFYKYISFSDGETTTQYLIENWQKYDTNNSKSKVKCVNFYNVNMQKSICVPIIPILENICSNGMCAGNTPEEALVQGFSEIFERYCAKEITENDYVCPIIPNENFLKYENISKIINFFEQEGYKVEIRDASLGKKYPVLMGIIIKDDAYCVNFGAHPVLNLAAERAFTEILQGFSSINEDFKNKQFNKIGVTYKNDEEKISCFLDHNWKINYQKYLSSKTSSWTYDSGTWHTSNVLNKVLLINYISLLKAYDYDILIRDVSFLGFPSYYVVVPQLSTNMISFKSYYENKINLLSKYLPYKYAKKLARNNFCTKIIFIMNALLEEDFVKTILLIEDYIDYILKLNVFQKKHLELINCLKEYVIMRNRGVTEETIIVDLMKKYPYSLVKIMQNKFLLKNSLHQWIRKYSSRSKKSRNYKIYKNIQSKIYKIYKKNIPNQKYLSKIFN